jgi:glycosyltransferase involved in cell wall biosynthesis
MDILFIHQNMPAQFRYLAPTLAARADSRVVFLTRRDHVDLPGIRRVTYAAPKPAVQATHHYVRRFEASVRYGQQVARALVDLKREGFNPAVIIGHPGWGEMLFVRDVFPNAAIISYAEFYYRAEGADIGFDPSEPVSLDTVCRTRARNAHLLLSLDLADIGLAPTQWQRSLHPPVYQQRIATIFDGINTALVRPDTAAMFTLPNGRTLSRNDEVVTYVARNFEPYRGYPSFIRSVPAILKERPDARIVIVGGDDVSYGKAPDDGATRYTGIRWAGILLRPASLS